MKKFITVTLICFSWLGVVAQEYKLTPYTQYLVENPFVISPAFAGQTDMQRLRLSGTFQWVGLDNAPNTQSLSYDRAIMQNSGVGVIIYNDKNGNTSQIGGQLSFAHHLILNDANAQYLSFGISYKFSQFRIRTSDFDNPNGDPNIGSDLSANNSNFEASALYKFQRFFFSVNVSNILNRSVKMFDGEEPKKLRNYYVYTGYTFLLDDGLWELEPSAYLKYYESDNRSATDLNFKAKRIINNGYWWVGLSSRFLNDQGFDPTALVPMGGLNKGQFYVGYAFQYNINESNELNHGGTHLLTLGYDFETSRGRTRW